MRFALLGLLFLSCFGSSSESVQRDFGKCTPMDLVAELAGKDFSVFGCENGDLVLIPLVKRAPVASDEPGIKPAPI